MTKPIDIDPSPATDQIVQKTIQIDAPVATVWAALTEPALMQRWMAETEIDVITDWQVGQPIVIRGDLHGICFENRGTVLQFEPDQLLQYTHLSSLSDLPGTPENHVIFAFQLAPINQQTTLTLTLRNFPTEAIYKHLAFYWPVALAVCKRMIEQPG
ncbi:MAG: SRPBCC domain-containing protein [Caldilineaceae bacterium]